ncbi:phosphatidylinositol-3-phosphatase SAC1-like [Pollicipes pollicipes]|uniref:phosphatidylinositol-3-phosphatase SAC1-like n=1 Tax=Pollicipes pollicipes TaxID=41117 RepID=UPI0018850943|nr:phosphatidylinositol-3-phosphatase SAC1-like [Pollicipes pollicipes]
MSSKAEAEFIYEDFVLHTAPEKFFIEPLQAPNEVLVIDRVSRDIALHNGITVPPIASRQRICGLLGTVRLLSGPYLVAITRKARVGELNKCTIWRVEHTEIIPFSRTTTHLTEAQERFNTQYVNMLEMVLRQPHFYFSYTYDITQTIQRLHNTTPEFLQIPLHERADPRFVWNSHLLRDLAARPGLGRFCLPVVHGFVSIKQCSLNGHPFSWSLVSRRNCSRAGTRMFMRGIDSGGNVANMVETEQIVEFQGDKNSFVQTRGSIPLFWSQYPNLRYKPTPTLSERDNHQEACTRHFDAQLFNYGKQVVINLIDQKGAEKKLGESMSSHIRQLNTPNVRYEAFDFHHECRHMRWDRLSILMDRIAEEQEEMGYFLMTRDGVLARMQDGVFRTNCIDCLDRTNVVQSMIAHRQLQQALQRLSILREDQRLEEHSGFEFLYKNVWADNADMISIQYSGTPALKTDFTRTGQRTKLGLVRDGYNSLCRYVKNNFKDGFRQDSIDLFLGNYQVEEDEGTARPSPLAGETDWRFTVLLAILLGSVFMFLTTVLVPSGEYKPNWQVARVSLGPRMNARPSATDSQRIGDNLVLS